MCLAFVTRQEPRGQIEIIIKISLGILNGVSADFKLLFYPDTEPYNSGTTVITDFSCFQQ